MILKIVPYIRVAITVLLGAIVIAYATDGLTIYTAEGKRRSDVEQYPRAMPQITFIDQTESPLKVSEFKGKTVLMEFIFTSCPSFCYAMGAEYRKLQRQIKSSEINNVVLVSVSFDFDRDGAEQIEKYASKFKAEKPYWYVVRASSQVELDRLLEAYEVIIVSDGSGGYDHDSAIHVLNQENALYKIIDFDAAEKFISTLVSG